MLVSGHPNRGAKWAMLISFGGQFLAGGPALLIPLIYTTGLPLVTWNILSLPSPPAPPAPERVKVRAVARAADPAGKVFSAPPAIPRQVLTAAADSPAVPMPLPASEMVVPGGLAGETGAAAVSLGLLAGPVVVPPAPPEKAMPAERSAAPLHVNGGVQAAKIVRRIVPVYPDLAKHAESQAQSG